MSTKNGGTNSTEGPNNPDAAMHSESEGLAGNRQDRELMTDSSLGCTLALTVRKAATCGEKTLKANKKANGNKDVVHVVCS